MTERPINVRVAVPQDEEAVFAILKLAHEENGSSSTLSPQKVIENIKAATEKRGGIIGVIDGEKGIEGVIFLILSQWWYSDDWHWMEMCNFVHSDCRRSDHAKNLIDFSKWVVEQMEMTLCIGVMSEIRTEAKVKLYQRRLKLGGAIFYHNHPSDRVIVQ